MENKYTLIAIVFSALLLISIGCSPKREKVESLRERIQNSASTKDTLIMVQSKPFTGIMYEEHPNGMISRELNVRKGLPHGVYSTYSKDGTLKEKIEYSNRARDYTIEEYWDIGTLRERKRYKNDEKDGTWEYYSYDGQLRTRQSYKIGVLDGLSEEYFEDGKLKRKGTYTGGEMNGIWEEYFDDGQKTKGSFRDGKEDGVWEFYVKEDGKDGKYILNMILTFKDGELIPSDEFVE